MQSSLVGTSLGQYQVVAELGRGGMGTVYKGIHPALNRTVAIKVLTPLLVNEPGFLERFRREAVLVASLKHPNILTIYDFGQQGQTFYIVMEYAAGATLKERPEGPMAQALATTLTAQVADALDHAHKSGIIHRDIKPANIMLDRPDFAKLGDFGIARIAGENTHLTRTGIGIGTPEYMSPEQGEGIRDIDGRSDIYSLGIVLFDLLTGNAPYHSTSVFDVIRQHIEQPLPVLALLQNNVSPDLVQIIVKATAKSPAGRYQSAADLRDALQATLRRSAGPGPATTVMPVPTGQTPAPFGTSVLLPSPGGPPVSPPPPVFGTSVLPAQGMAAYPPAYANPDVTPTYVNPAPPAYANPNATPTYVNPAPPAAPVYTPPAYTPPAPPYEPPAPSYDPPAEPEERGGRPWGLLIFLFLGLLVCVLSGLGGFFLSQNGGNFSSVLGAAIASPSATATSSPTPTPTAASSATPTTTPVPPTATATEVPTEAPAAEPTATPAPPTATPTRPPAAPAGPPGPAAPPTNTAQRPEGGGIIEVRNNYPDAVTCNYSGTESRSITVPGRSTGRITTAPGNYTESCTVNGASIAQGPVTVPADTPLIRVANPPATAGGNGNIVVRNERREAIVCTYNGGGQSRRLDVVAGGSNRVAVPAGSYQERCTTAAGIVISEGAITVQVDVDTVRVARP